MLPNYRSYSSTLPTLTPLHCNLCQLPSATRHLRSMYVGSQLASGPQISLNCSVLALADGLPNPSLSLQAAHQLPPPGYITKRKRVFFSVRKPVQNSTKKAVSLRLPLPRPPPPPPFVYSQLPRVASAKHFITARPAPPPPFCHLRSIKSHRTG